jgi:hypothetical protein
MPNQSRSSSADRRTARGVFHRLTGNRRGSVALQTALIMLVLLGMVSLGVEVTFLLMKHRQMQTAADAAAVAGASAISISEAAITNEAKGVSADQGYIDGVDQTTVTVNHPPLKGAHVGDGDYVEAIVSQPQTLSLARLFRANPYEVGARAVAGVTGGGGGCIFALDPSASSAMILRNNAEINAPSCAVVVNSSSNQGLYLYNNAIIRADVSVYGHEYLRNNAEITGDITRGSTSPDPYLDRVIPTTGTARTASCSSGGTVTLQPGRYAAGFNCSNGTTVNLQPGVYLIDTRLNFGNNVTFNGTGGVTLVINGNYTINSGNGARVNIVAPTSGGTAGLAIVSRSTNSLRTQTFENNAVLNILGALYFPSQTVAFSNNAVISSTRCTQLVARRIDMANNASFNNDCTGVGTDPIGGAGAAVKLVE